MPYVIPADLSLTHLWQNERNAAGQDPTDLLAYQDWLRDLGKFYTEPRRYGAITLQGSAPAPPVPKPINYEASKVLYLAPKASIRGVWTDQNPPRGVILHGSRSGRQRTEYQEWLSTAAYCRDGAWVYPPNEPPYLLAWNVTIGPDRVAIHLLPSQWGWNAGDASDNYLGVEFAQTHPDNPVSDAQVNAFCWWFVEVARARWPGLPREFVYHSEVPQGIRDGKTDLYSRGSPAGIAFEGRVNARLDALGAR